MNGELAQVTALVAHGNSYLRTGRLDEPHMEATNSTFQYVGSVRFRKSDGAEIAGGVAGWLGWLRERGVDRLRFATAPDEGELPAHIAAAFAGGNNLGIVAQSARGDSLWVPGWSHAGDRAKNPWLVTYREDRVHGPWSHSSPSLADARKDLAHRLTDAASVAGEMAVDHWRDWFIAALDKLDDAEPRTEHTDDVLPAHGYALRARQLFAAAVGAWVFGGMGWWNDYIVEDEALRQRYNDVSAALFASIHTALAAVLESAFTEEAQR